MSTIEQRIVTRTLKMASRLLPITYKIQSGHNIIEVAVTAKWAFSFEDRVSPDDISGQAEAISEKVLRALASLNDVFNRKVYELWPETELHSVYIDAHDATPFTKLPIAIATMSDGLCFRGN